MKEWPEYVAMKMAGPEHWQTMVHPEGRSTTSGASYGALDFRWIYDVKLPLRDVEYKRDLFDKAGALEAVGSGAACLRRLDI